MADEEEENVQTKTKKEKEVVDPAAASINPVEYKMFDKANMQKTLSIPQKLVYSFNKELAGTLQKRLETVRLKHGADDSKQVIEKSEGMEIVAGRQPWEVIDPQTGQLVDALPVRKPGVVERPDVKQTTGKGAQNAPVMLLTTSVSNMMRASLPRAKTEDRSTMPAANRRLTATENKTMVRYLQGRFNIRDERQYKFRKTFHMEKFVDVSFLLTHLLHVFFYKDGQHCKENNFIAYLYFLLFSCKDCFIQNVGGHDNFEYGDYYETAERLDRQWKSAISVQPSDIKAGKRQDAKAKDGKDPEKKRRMSVGLREAEKETSATRAFAPHATITKPAVVKSKVQKGSINKQNELQQILRFHEPNLD